MSIFKRSKPKPTDRLPMTGSVRRGFKFYCAGQRQTRLQILLRDVRDCHHAVQPCDAGVRVGNHQRPADGHQQPVGFRIRTDSRRRHDYAWLRHCAGGLVAQIARPVAESQRLSDAGGRRGHHFCAGNPEPHHRRLMKAISFNPNAKDTDAAHFTQAASAVDYGGMYYV